MNIALIIIGLLIAISLPAFCERHEGFLSSPYLKKALAIIGTLILLTGILIGFFN